MAKKQTELPGTRRDDEPEPQKPIRALDDACEALEKARGKATRAGQAVIEAKKAAQAVMLEHKIAEYEYESSDGVLQDVFRENTLKKRKSKLNPKKSKKGDE
jgi:hypothetical protein